MKCASIFAVDTETTLLKGQVDLSILQGDEVQLVGFAAPSILFEVWHLLEEHKTIEGDLHTLKSSAFYFVSDIASACMRLSIGTVVASTQSLQMDEHTVTRSEMDCIPVSVLLNNSTIACSMLTSIEVLRLLDSFVQPHLGCWIIHNATSYGLDHYLIQLAKRRGIGVISILDHSKRAQSFQNDPQHHIVVEGPKLKAEVMNIVRQDPVCLGLDTGTHSAPIVSLLNSIQIKQYACFSITQNIEKTSTHSLREHLFFSLDSTFRNQKSKESPEKP